MRTWDIFPPSLLSLEVPKGWGSWPLGPPSGSAMIFCIVYSTLTLGKREDVHKTQCLWPEPRELMA